LGCLLRLSRLPCHSFTSGVFGGRTMSKAHKLESSGTEVGPQMTAFSASQTKKAMRGWRPRLALIGMADFIGSDQLPMSPSEVYEVDYTPGSARKNSGQGRRSSIASRRIAMPQFASKDRFGFLLAASFFETTFSRGSPFDPTRQLGRDVSERGRNSARRGHPLARRRLERARGFLP